MSIHQVFKSLHCIVCLLILLNFWILKTSKNLKPLSLYLGVCHKWLHVQKITVLIHPPSISLPNCPCSNLTWPGLSLIVCLFACLLADGGCFSRYVSSFHHPWTDYLDISERSTKKEKLKLASFPFINKNFL